MNVKILLRTVGLLAVVIAGARAEGLLEQAPAEIGLASVYNVDKSQRLRWKISRLAFSKLPKYSDEARLQVDLKTAIRTAENWANSKNPDMKLQLVSVEFRQPSNVDNWDNVFFYFVTFDVIDNEGDSELFSVLVLPDGKVLEPDEIKLAPAKPN